MSSATILELLEISAKESWPFLKYYAAIKKAGAARYHVNLLYPFNEWQMTDGSSFKVKKDFSLIDITISPLVNLEKFKEILKDHQAGNSSYLEWLQASANVGLQAYTVDTQMNQVSYFGKNGLNAFYVEKVPQGSE